MKNLKKTIGVLYIDGVGPFGGASRSLYEAVRKIKIRGVSAYFCVADGTASEFYKTVADGLLRTRGLTRFDNTSYSFYRGVRWLVLLRELFHFPFTVGSLFISSMRWRRYINLIHVNEITEIIPGLIAKIILNVPLVIHVRSVQRVNKNSIRLRVLNFFLRRYADAIIAIDETVRASLPADLDVDVIHNSFSIEKNAKINQESTDIFGKFRVSSLKVGFVGNIHISKGILELVEAARLLKEQGVDVEFLIVGGHTRVDGGLKGWALRKAGLVQDVLDVVEQRIRQYGLRNSFHMLGPTSDIQHIYDRLDVITFPSHFDAPGRPVFEAAFSAVPSIVCVSNPLPDTLIHNVTGLAIPARDPVALSEAIRYCEKNRNEVRRMGSNAQKLAIDNFEPAHNASRLLDVYKRVCKLV